MNTSTQGPAKATRSTFSKHIIRIWILILVAITGLTPQATAAVRYVDYNATGENDGTSWADAYTSLQDALTATIENSNDEIWVAAGTYKPTTADGDRTISFALKTNVALYGGFAGTETGRSERDWTTNETILSGDLNGDDGPGFANNGDNSYHVVVGSGTDNTAVLDGFTITGGNADGTDPFNNGGGMYNDSGDPTITNSTFTRNSALRGGGIYNVSSSPAIINSTFSMNSATSSSSSYPYTSYSYGGGMYNSSSSPTITNCIFSGNRAESRSHISLYSNTPKSYSYGGGMYNSSSSPTITDCTFSGNRATSDSDSYPSGSWAYSRAYSYGGGMYNSSSSPTITNCTFSGNRARSDSETHRNNEDHTDHKSYSHSYGGGMYNSSSFPIITKCTFSENSASSSSSAADASYSYSYGGGMHNLSFSPAITNCTFSGNSATSSARYAYSHGGGMFNRNASPTIINSILWGNTASNGDNIYGSGSTISYSDIQGSGGSRGWNTALGTDGGGNIDHEPRFVDAAKHLSDDSPCINAGTATGAPADDMNGESRPFGGKVDIGADEFSGTYGDNDTDTLWDYWEYRYFGDLLQGPSVDPDADDADNDQEFQEDTDPAWNDSIVFVDGTNGNDANHGHSWLQAKETIQIGITTAQPGDTVLVRADIYTGSNNKNLDFGGKDITLRSETADPADVIIDCETDGRGFSFHSGETADAVVEGFTIQNGRVTDDNGAGMYIDNSSPTIRNCIFDTNIATSDSSSTYGGGIYISGSDASPTITDCTFSGNTATYGGGMRNDSNASPTITNSTFSNNEAVSYGGGMSNSNASPTITNSTFSGNSAIGGGGMDNYNTSSPTITNSTFADNTVTSYGGGMVNSYYSSPTITNSTFADNTAGNDGGGMYNNNASPTITNSTFANNTAGNDGGGMYNNNASPTISNCTFADNEAPGYGGGLHNNNSSLIIITNSILWGNTANYGAEIYNANLPVELTISYSNIQDSFDEEDAWVEDLGTDGGGNIDREPRFVDAANGDLHLSDDSPCINAGTATGAPADDMDGENRPFDDSGVLPSAQQNKVDIGADEFSGDYIDNDGDELPDYWEYYYFGDLLQGPSDNPDADGPDNAQEFQDSTDPNWNKFIYVDKGTGDDNNDGHSWGDAKQTIQAALNAAQGGDTVVLVRADTYEGTGNKNLDFQGKAITLRSEFGNPADVIIDCENDGRGFYFHNDETAGAFVEGFTIRNGSADFYGGGISIENASPTIRNVVLESNHANYDGGGMYIDSAAPVISNVIFRGNSASFSGGGIAIFSASPTISNAVFSGNSAADYGGAIYNSMSSFPTIVNSSFSGNSATLGGGLFNIWSSPILSNSVLWGDSGGEVVNNDTSTPVFTFCNIQGSGGSNSWNATFGTDGGRNIDRDPRFADADLHLSGDSPCLNAGTRVGAPTDDIDADVRPSDDKVEIGADEFTGDYIDNDNGDGTGDGLPDYWEYYYFGDLAQGAADDPDNDDKDNAQEYADGTDPTGDDDYEHPDTIFVDGQTGDDTNPGHSWTQAKRTIQAGIDAAVDGNTVRVRAGTYTGAGNKNLDFDGKAITLRSESGPELTIIDCEDSGRGFDFHTDETAAAVVEGFTIQNGQANNGGGMKIYEASPTITNCIFQGNTATDDGGAMHNYYAFPTIINVVFRNNDTIGGTYSAGGAMYNLSSDPTISNCTFVGNTAPQFGGGLYNAADSFPIITNSILWGNTAPSGAEIRNYHSPEPNDASAEPTISYSNIQGSGGSENWNAALGTDGGGNIDREPRFVDAANGNLDLSGDSPCINAGTSDGAPSIDIEGEPRPFDGKVDLGVDEFSGAYIDNDNGNGTGDGLPDYWEYYYFGDLAQGSADDPDEDDASNLVEYEEGTDPTDGGDFYLDNTTFVKTDGDDSEDGHNWEDAKQTIQAGLNAVQVGQTVVVRAGTYNGAGNKNLDFGGKDITLRSETGNPADVIINCEGSGRGISFSSGETAAAVVKGLTIYDGSAGYGGGISVSDASPTLINIIFDSNHANYDGGGLYLSNASLAVSNCVFYNNQATWRGGGLYINDSSPTLSNTVVSGNSAIWLGGGLYNNNASPTLTNSIVWGNSGGDVLNSSSGRPVFSYCLVPGAGFNGAGWDPELGTDGGGNFDSDPRFEDAANGDLHLAGDSPCINAGTEGADVPDLDIDGNVRPFDGKVDIGADEFSGDYIDSDTDELPDYWEWYYFDSLTPGSEDDSDIDSENNGVEFTKGTDPASNARLIVVDGEKGNDDNSGNSWRQAKKTIQAGIDAANLEDLGYTVIVRSGTYSGAGNKNLDFGGKAITLQTESGPEKTIIDCDGDGRGFWFHGSETASSVVSGLTIRNGSAYQIGDQGGGMKIENGSSPTVTNMVFDSNEAISGGGIYISGGSSPTITDCEFEGNTATLGGGMYNSNASPTITNVIFDLNTAYNSGGGMSNYNASSPTITNSTFSNNSANAGGGMSNSTSSPTITNSTFSTNTATDDGGAMNNYNASPTITNVVFWENSTTGDTYSVGGAMYNLTNSNPTIKNCTFAGNTAPVNDGGLHNNTSSPIITNSILWGNAPESGSGVEISNVGSSNPTISYSNIQGSGGSKGWNAALGTDGGGNIDLDPRFADDLHLSDDSPCINAGTATDAPADDLDGENRPFDDSGVLPSAQQNKEDIGADEFTGDYIDNDNGDGTGDGLLDYWEWYYFGSLSEVPEGPSGDTDEDGANNEQEFEDGTDPAETIFVDDGANGSDDNSGRTRTQAKQTIQAGINAAQPGETVLVLEDSYTSFDGTTYIPGNSDLDFGGKDITLRSENGDSAEVTIDVGCSNDGCPDGAYHRGFIFWNGETDSSIVTGITIKNGHAVDGGGMYISSASPTITNVVFDSNTAGDEGGGLYNNHASPTLIDCTFSENEAVGDGGGGIFNYYSDPVIIGVDFEKNEAQGSSGAGGGMCNYEGNNYNNLSTFPTITDCTFSGNEATAGGGMSNSNSSPTITNSTFSGNKAEDDGGAMNNYSASPTITNVVFWQNRTTANSGHSAGGAMYNLTNSNPTISNCTFAGNEATDYGGGLHNNNSSPTITNSILWGNAVNSGAEIYNVGSAQPTISYSNIQGSGGSENWNAALALGTDGGGNIDTDPRFVNSDDGDGPDGEWRTSDDGLRLTEFSPCIDTGTVITDENIIGKYSDVRGSLRPLKYSGDGSGWNADFDMGAYEYAFVYNGKDGVIKAFTDISINSSQIIPSIDDNPIPYTISWKNRIPFPNNDPRIMGFGQDYTVRFVLQGASGRRELGTATVPTIGPPDGYTAEVTFAEDHIGTWTLRVELADDPTQFAEAADPVEIPEAVPETWIIGEEIIPPEGAVPGSNPTTDLDNFYWHSTSLSTGKLYAVGPVTTTLRWIDTDGYLLMVLGTNEWPHTPQIHVASSAPVDLLPDGSPYTSVAIAYQEEDVPESIENTDQFTETGAGYSVLRYSQSNPNADPHFVVVNTVLWNDPDYFTVIPWDIGLEIRSPSWIHAAACANGFVFHELAPYAVATTGSAPYDGYVRATRSGPIVPVNLDNKPDTDNDLVVVWYQQDTGETDSTGVCWPYKPVRYIPEWPDSAGTIIIAGQEGSSAYLTDPQQLQVYHQPDSAQAGYNPNEEHALVIGTTAYALRNDLNTLLRANPDDSDSLPVSEPYLIVKYLEEQTWRFRAFGISTGSFSYSGTAGTEIQPPTPLDSLLPVCEDNTYDDEVDIWWEDAENILYARKAGRGTMRFFYRLQEGFFYDFEGQGGPDANIGTCIPWLDEYAGTSGIPFDVTYNITWPDDIKRLYVGDTLITAKYGLPEINKQCSVEVIYDQSKEDLDTGPAVELLEGLSDHWVAWGEPGQTEQDVLPADIIYSQEGNNTVSFRDLPPDLIQRVFYDYGNHRLIFRGLYVEPLTGQPYVLPNIMSIRERETIKALSSATDDPNYALFQDAVDTLFARTKAWSVPVPVQLGFQLTASALENLTLEGVPDNIVGILGSSVTQCSNSETDFETSFSGKLDTPYYNDLILKHAQISLIDLITTDVLGVGNVRFSDLPADTPSALGNRILYNPATQTLTYVGIVGDGGNLQKMVEDEKNSILGLISDGTCGKTTFNTVLGTLSTQSQTAPGAGVDKVVGTDVFKMLSAAGPEGGCGYVTLAMNNDPATCGGNPVGLYVLKVEPDVLAPGELKVLYPDNVFDEEVTFRHSGDFAGNPDALTFEWRVHVGADQPDDLPDADLGAWQILDKGQGMNAYTVGGSGIAALQDKWITVRYRGYNRCGLDPDNDWSPWTEAKLYENWVKRVIRAINLFEQRFSKFHTHELATYVSMLTQAGTRYEGDIALNDDPNYLNSLGLIELYTTVLNRARKLSIDGTPSKNEENANNALLFATSRIADLYMLLGNEAYGDAVDPTIGYSTEDAVVGNAAPSIFCFQNQADSLLQEELELLRGRDTSRSGVRTRPLYNRLIWNFTSGDGQVAYANNYVVETEEQAAAQYPQGHGDAWGHYLTAIKTYYTLLRHPYFTWLPEIDYMLVAGEPVLTDYGDEREFVTAAAAKARTGAEIVNLSYRDAYVDNPQQQWQGYRDSNSERGWGLSEWAVRAGQGTYIDWVAANAMLPEEDLDHTGIEKVDRQTLTELPQIASRFTQIEDQLDQADAGLNPLGVAKDAIPFDIDPVLVDSGQTHFEQVYERALRALQNASVVFDYANEYSQLLRRHQDTVETYQQNVAAQERDFTNRLIEVFGYPYADDPAYPAGYDGPDIFHYDYIDPRETVGFEGEMLDTLEFTLTMRVYNWVLNEDEEDTLEYQNISIPFHLNDQFGLIKPPEWTGSRRAPGEIQQVRSDLLMTRAKFAQALDNYDALVDEVQILVDELEALHDLKDEHVDLKWGRVGAHATLGAAQMAAFGFQKHFEIAAETAEDLGEAGAEALPRSTGVIAGMSAGAIIDALAPARGATIATSTVVKTALMTSAAIAEGVGKAAEITKEALDMLNELEIIIALDDVAIKEQLSEVKQLLLNETTLRYEIYMRYEELLQAAGRYQAALAKGLRIWDERTAYRTKVADDVLEARYKDMAFRIFRNDAIQKYRAQFDLAARYVYLAAKAYDYETGLLSSHSGAGERFFTNIVRQRTLGELYESVGSGVVIPLTGRGLADQMAQMNQNFAVLKGQMGFNNPQIEENRFSLRQEHFRILGNTNSDAIWQGVLGQEQHQIENLWALREFRRFCRPFAAEDPDTPEPALVIPFDTSIYSGQNLFGWPLGAGDSYYDSSRFATKIRSVGVWFENYDTSLLAQTPRVYFVPVGSDIIRSPYADSFSTRVFDVMDQSIPIPFPISDGNMSDPGWIPFVDLAENSGEYLAIRRHSRMRAYHDSGSGWEDQLQDSRLIGRSVWNSKWLLIIPGRSLRSDPDEALTDFINSVTDIKFSFETYSYEGYDRSHNEQSMEGD